MAWKEREAMAALVCSTLIPPVRPMPPLPAMIMQRSFRGASVSPVVEGQSPSCVSYLRKLSSSYTSMPLCRSRLGSKSVRCEADGEGSRESFDGTVYQGIYGPWTIEPSDVREVCCAFVMIGRCQLQNQCHWFENSVILYRSGLVTTASSFVLATSVSFIPDNTFFGDFLMQNIDFLYVVGAGGLGLSLLLIHIYVTPIKRFLQALWAIGISGSAATYLNLAKPLDEGLVQYLIDNPIAVWFVGPLFAALTGLVFKEGLCYGKLEAGVLTFIIPCLLLGHLTGLMDNGTKLNLLGLWMALFVVFAARKFQQPIKDDIGDKSIFNFNALPEDDKESLLKKLEQKNDGMLD